MPEPVLQPSNYLELCSLGRSSTLLYAPNTVLNSAIVTAAASLLSSPQEAAACHIEGFARPADLLDAYMNSTTRHQATVAAILFDGQPTNHTIALARGKVSWVENERRDFSWPSMAASHVAFEGQNDGDTVWMHSGFVGLQWAIGQAIISVSGGVNSTSLVNVTRMPLQPYASSYGSGSGLLQFLLPLFGTNGPMINAFLLGQVCACLALFAVVHFVEVPLFAFFLVALVPQVACMIGISIFVQVRSSSWHTEPFTWGSSDHCPNACTPTIAPTIALTLEPLDAY